MNGERLNQIIRTLLLLGLLGVFIWLLIAHLLEDREALGFGRLRQGVGQDPGVRVLIANRLPPEPINSHDKVVIEMLQETEVVAPDDPLGKHELLKAGAVLRVEVVGNDGFLLSSRDWSDGSKDRIWAVQTFLVMPRHTRPATDNRLDRDGNPILPIPRKFESADQRAVFRLQGIDPKFQPLYRGSLQVLWNSPKDMQLINHLPMEAYLEGVIAVEMSPSYPLEALKAQAIASRGFAYCQAAAAVKRPFDLVDTREDQEYRGAGFSTLGVIKAVLDTRGVIPTVHGNPFIPLFSASSGGYTTAIEAVFPGAKDLYGREALAAVMLARPDPYCLPGVIALGKQDTHWETSNDILSQDIQKKLAQAMQAEAAQNGGQQLGFINQIRVGRRDPRSTRVETLLVSHTLATNPLEIPASTFRKLVGPQIIKSTLWNPESPKKIEGLDRKFRWHITSYGWGHGVGMSQVSAWEMAHQGKSARSIIEFFYTDVEMKALW
jgi:SpoIID/LytB domain protein